jgi:hypothetical protein
LQRECDAAEGEKKNVEENRNQEQRKGGKLAKLEEAVAELDKGLVKIELKSTSRTRRSRTRVGRRCARSS